MIEALVRLRNFTDDWDAPGIDAYDDDDDDDDDDDIACLTLQEGHF